MERPPTPGSWMRINIVKMVILPKSIYRFNTISIKIQKAFFTEIEETIFTFVWKHQRPQKAKGILRKNNKAKRIMLLISNYTTKPY